MALRLSTGLRNFLMANGSLKRALNDGILRIYSGSQPASADDAVTGTLLVSITLASGAFTEGVESVAQTDKATLTYGSDGDSYVLVINGTSYTYVAQSGDDAAAVATALARLLNWDPDVAAVANSNVVNVIAKQPGESYTIANTGSTTPGNVVLANLTANSRGNGIHMGSVASGVLSKEAGTWSGVAVASGTAGWFRWQANASDDDTSSTTLKRLDGNIGTSGANLNMSSTSITSAATTTIDTTTITEPAS